MLRRHRELQQLRQEEVRVAHVHDVSARCIQKTWRKKVVVEREKQHVARKLATERHVRERASVDGVSAYFRGHTLGLLARHQNVIYRPPGLFDSQPSFLEASLRPAMVYAPSLLPNQSQDETSWCPAATTFDNQDAIMVSQLLQYVQGRGCQLKHVVLCGADLMDERASTALTTAFTKNRSVRSLAIGDCKLSPMSTEALLQGLLHNFYLEELIFDSMPDSLDDNNEVLLCTLGSDYFLQRFGSLHSLALCRNWISDRGADVIAQALKSPLCRLTSLILTNNNIGDPGGMAIGVALQFSKTLAVLDLGGNKLESAGAAAIGHALAGHVSLRTLVLRGNLIRDDIVPLFIRSLSSNTVLSSLDMTENIFRPERANMLATAMARRQQAATLMVEVVQPPPGRTKTSLSSSFTPNHRVPSKRMRRTMEAASSSSLLPSPIIISPPRKKKALGASALPPSAA